VRRITGFLAHCAAALLLGTGVVIPASARDYLPAIGPAPMRYGTPPPSDTPVTWKELNPVPATNEDTNAPSPTVPAVTNTVSAATNTVAAVVVPKSVDTNETLIASSAANSNETNFVSQLIPPEILTLAPANAPMVTPQILADYLQPGPVGKNPRGGGILMPVDVGFNPPVAAPAPESRAIYKSE